MPKPLTVWITTNCGKFLKRWQYQTTLPVSWEICMQVKKQQLKLDMEPRNSSKLGKEYVKAVYCHPAYLTDMQSTSCEMPQWNQDSPLHGNYSVFIYLFFLTILYWFCHTLTWICHGCTCVPHPEPPPPPPSHPIPLGHPSAPALSTLESRFKGETAITSDMQMTPPLWKKVKN